MGGTSESKPVAWRTAWPFAALAGRRPLVLQLALAILQALLPVAGLVAMQRLIDAVAAGLAGRTAADAAIAAATSATLLAAAVALLGSLVRGLVAVVGEAHGRALADAALTRVQTHASRVALAAFDRPRFHDLLQRASTEAGQRPQRFVQDAIATAVAGVGLLVMVALLGQVSWWLPMLVALAGVPLAWTRRRHARLRAAWHDEHVADQRDAAYAGAVLTGRATAKDLRVLGGAGAWLARAATLRAGLRHSLHRLAVRRSRDELLVHALASIGLFAAYWWLARAALAGELTLGTLVLQAQAAQRTQNGVRDLLAALAGEHEHRLLLRPLVEFLAWPVATVATPPPVAPPPGPLALAATDVAFRYPEAPRDALRALTFAIAAGEHIAIVGPNGSGKSTLLKLLAQLYAPSAGSLAANGVDLARVAAEEHRARLSVLLQDAALFELSIRDNLGNGPGEPPDDATCWRALTAVGLADRVRALPNGLATPCSRRLAGGVDWSVGEARRLVLARALAQPADLRLLDEPFLALDGAQATALAQQLAARSPRATLVVVDHHPAALLGVDRVFVLEHGALVAAGTPAAVAAQHPGFRALFPSLGGGG